jgi:iron complex transport system substrate-binding protein
MPSFPIRFIAILLAVATTADAARIVSLTPATTEILFALGADNDVVGVSSLCAFPSTAAAKPRTGTFSRPNMEIILTLRPDLILATGLEQAPAVQELRRLGFHVEVSDPASFDELFDSIRNIGRLTGRSTRAEEIITDMRRDITAVVARAAAVPDDKRPTVFVEIWHTPLMTAGAGSFIDEMIRLAGGVNIAHDAPRPYSLFSPEVVLSRNPSHMILAYMARTPARDRVENRFAWNTLSAVRQDHVYGDIDPDLILRPGPRLTRGLVELQNRILP